MAQVSSDSPDTRWQIDGKFFRRGESRIQPRMVTYGPFPGGWPSCFREDFKRISAAGFEAIRLYSMPPRRMLVSARDSGIKVFAGLAWEQNSDFLSGGARLAAAKIELAEWLTEHADEPALAGVYVGNEIPADLVRWMGPARVQSALEDLIALGRQVAPHLLFAYANFPSTEYLEPGNADFSAFNVYLENESDFERYLLRLQHVAGDRPLVISEFGLDSQRHGTQRQAELIGHAIDIAERGAAAGFTVFAWSDRWLSGGIEVEDWAFGLTDRDGRDKPALGIISHAHGSTADADPPSPGPVVSAIVCTRNGRERIGSCLRALRASRIRHRFELIVVDDGSNDATAQFVRENFPEVTLIRTEHGGLSAARNAGAQRAKAEILAYTDDDCEPDRDWLQRVYDLLEAHPDYAAVGGPNLPQQPKHWREAVICAAPGAPSHVMLDDVTAEHLPGCNLVVRKSALEQLGGFDPRFHTAGDDVDFCWRLQDAGMQLGFDPGAFVWHWRRPTLRGYLRQQIGYGKAERMLIKKHPQRFSKGGAALWEGFIYNGAPVRMTRNAVIYHGTAEKSAYHPMLSGVQVQRDLDGRFENWKSRVALMLISWLAPALRGWQRTRRLRSWLPQIPTLPQPYTHSNRQQWAIDGVHRNELIGALLQAGWTSCASSNGWDLEKQGTRVIFATELGEEGAKVSLVGVDGDASAVRIALGNF